MRPVSMLSSKIHLDWVGRSSPISLPITTSPYSNRNFMTSTSSSFQERLANDPRENAAIQLLPSYCLHFQTLGAARYLITFLLISRDWHFVTQPAFPSVEENQYMDTR